MPTESATKVIDLGAQANTRRLHAVLSQIDGMSPLGEHGAWPFTITEGSDGFSVIVPDAVSEGAVMAAFAAHDPTPDPPPVTDYAGSIAIAERLRTTNATPTELYRATLAPLTGYRATVTLLGVDAGNGAVRAIEARITAKRLNNGALLVGSPVIVANHADAAATTWDIAANVSGNDFVITVAGAASRNIDWLLDGHVVSFTPGGR